MGINIKCSASGSGISGEILQNTGTVSFSLLTSVEYAQVTPYLIAIDWDGRELEQADSPSSAGGNWAYSDSFYITPSTSKSVSVDMAAFRAAFSGYQNLGGVRLNVFVNSSSEGLLSAEDFDFYFVRYTACTPPTSVSVASNNVAANANVKLSWSGAKAGTGVSIKGYDVYRATSATGSYTRLSTVTTTETSGSINVTAPSDNGSYYYKIVTLSSVAGYDSAQSSTYATLTCKITTCGTPTSLSLATTSSTGENVRLSWSGAKAGTNNKISGYEVQRRESTNNSSWSSWSSLGTTTNTYLNVAPPATAGNYYQYQVRTLGSAGASYNSGWKTSSNTLRRSYTACGAPTACAVDSTLSLVATTLRWSGATAGYGNPISKYEVQRRSKVPGGTWSAWSTFETTSGTSLSVSPPAVAGNYYQYRVRAQGTAGEAYYSGWKESTNTLRKAHKTIPAFTDPTLIVGQTDVKAVHITELQNVLNDVLLPFMGVSKVTFTELERDSNAKYWGAHVQEIKDAIDSTGVSHDSWVVMQDEVTADVIDQIRRIVRSM